MDNEWRNARIEEAAKAIGEVREVVIPRGDGYVSVTEADNATLARAALAVFEKAHTPTDDEREALAHLIGYELYAEQMAKAVGGRPDRSGFDSLGVVFKDTWLDLTRPIAEVILAAGFRRSADPEPQGEPSDAPSYNPDGKTVAATVDWVKRNYVYLPGQDDEYVGQIIDALEAAHAALRAASAVTEQGENR